MFDSWLEEEVKERGGGGKVAGGLGEEREWLSVILVLVHI